MSNAQWHEDQSIGERAMRKHERLLAAAPDLLAACKEALAALDDLTKAYPTLSNVACCTKKQLLKAIEKAG